MIVLGLASTTGGENEHMTSRSLSRRLVSGSLALAPMLLVTGKADAIGRDFKRPEPESLELGKTTSAEVIAKLGAAAGPLSTMKPQNEPEDLPPGLRRAAAISEAKGLLYYYSYGPGPNGGKDIHSKALTLVFWNDRLISHSYSSSVPGDITTYNESKLSSFVRGRTTRGDVVREMGRAGGEGIYPFIADQGNRTVSYSYHSTVLAGSYFKPATETTTRMARFLFDPSDRLIDTYTSDRTTTRGVYDK